MSQETSVFWNWFKENSKQLAALNAPNIDEDEKDNLLNAMLAVLHHYCDQLYFDIGGEHDETQELVITAEGKADYFDKVEELIGAAPDMPGWSFTALMPARGLPDTSIFEDVELKPFEMWFLPLDNKHEPKSI